MRRVGQRLAGSVAHDKSQRRVGGIEAHVRREERELFAFFPDDLDDTEAERVGDGIRRVLATRGPARCDL